MKRFGVFLIFAIVLQVLVISPAYSQVSSRSYYVRADGDDENNNGRSEEAPFRTLNKAIEMATRGAVKTIIVIGRIEGGAVFINSGSAEIVVKGKENVQEDECAILRNSGKAAIAVSGNSKIRLENIELTESGYGIIVGGRDALVILGKGSKITNCFFSGSGFYSIGDAIYYPGGIGANVLGGSLIMEGDAIITGNDRSKSISRDSIDGGGVYVTSGTLIMKDTSTITGNSSNFGGGVCIESTFQSIINGKWQDINGILIMQDNSSITNNKSEFGGGVFAWGDVTIKGNSIISGNSAEIGGGLLCSEGKILLQDSMSIINNTAVKNGGGIYAGGLFFITDGGSRSYYPPGADDSFIIRDEAKITENKSKNGGGIFISGCKLSVLGGEIIQNKAEYGAGIYADIYRDSSSKIFTGNITVSNGSINKNEAEFVGGGVYAVTNSIFSQSDKASVAENIAGDGEGENVFKQQ